MISHIFMISLPDAEKRRHRMRAVLKETGLSWEIVDGVIGKDLADIYLAQRFDNYASMKLGRGEYGCLLSHDECWRRLLASDRPHVIIAEDDIHIAPGFRESVEQLEIADDTVAVYRLETMLATVTADRVPAQRLVGRDLYRIFTNHGGTGAYAINRKTAATLSGAFRRMRHSLDIELFSPDRRVLDGIEVYQLHPAPCMQDMILPPHKQVLGADSMLAGAREDALIFAAPRPLEKRVKALLRPLWRRLQSLRLYPKGKRRLKVLFG